VSDVFGQFKHDSFHGCVVDEGLQDQVLVGFVNDMFHGGSQLGLFDDCFISWLLVGVA